MQKLMLILQLFLTRSSVQEACDVEDKCLWINQDDQGSIIVASNEGRLGNKLHQYVILLGLKMKYPQVQVFMPRSELDYLTPYFDNLEIQAAEDHICHFKSDFQAFEDGKTRIQAERMRDLIKNQTGIELRLDPLDGKVLIPEDLDQPLDGLIKQASHSKEHHRMPPDLMTKPWIVFGKGNISQMEEEHLLKGHAVLLYSPGVDLSFAMTQPNFEQKFDSNFQFKAKYNQMAEKTLSKLKKFQLFVGVHVRRGDYGDYEKVQHFKPIKPSYYMEAMEMYRLHFHPQKLAFLIISDDIQWCKKHLKKAKDVFFVTNEEKRNPKDSVGHDLALMSKCNHTILSRGSFSYYASIFGKAGDAKCKVLPCHFAAYQDFSANVYHICFRHPLEKPISRFYPITN